MKVLLTIGLTLAFLVGMGLGVWALVEFDEWLWRTMRTRLIFVLIALIAIGVCFGLAYQITHRP